MLSTAVLVLNRNFQAVQVTTARRAFCLLFRGAAHAVGRDFQTFDFSAWSALVSDNGHDVVHTPSAAIRVPRVIQLLGYDRVPRPSVRFSRANVFTRDRNTCQYCGRSFPRHKLNIDHVIPKSLGGDSSWENVVCSCVSCNRIKGGRLLKDAGLRLLRQPRRPVWSPLFRRDGVEWYDEWTPFLAPEGRLLSRN
ncbi:MAG: HNH endonuclease [Deltaproteobacteria bacterium]|nr:HNH endonuclease [Deltaproteobacteria bacterium]